MHCPSPVAEISSAGFSTKRKQAPRWGAATIEVAGQRTQAAVRHLTIFSELRIIHSYDEGRLEFHR